MLFNIKGERRSKKSEVLLRSISAILCLVFVLAACVGCTSYASSDEVATRNAELNDAIAELDSLKESYEAAQKEMDALKSGWEEAQKELDALKTSNETAQQEITSLKTGNYNHSKIITSPISDDFIIFRFLPTFYCRIS